MAALMQTFVCRPARVESYDATTNTCTALVLLPQVIDAPSGRRSQDFQPLSNVPVLQLRAGGVSFTVKPHPGDLVLLLFSDRSLDLLLDTGQGGEPGDARHHDLMDAMALPAFFTFSDVPADVGTASIGMESAPGNPGLRIHFTGEALCLGEAAPAYHVALAEKVKTELEALRGTLASLVQGFNLHTHLSAAAGSPTGVPSASVPPITAAAPAPVGDMASTTVKVKG